MAEGNVGINCRLAVRGFKDQFQDSDTYAGATRRAGQRLVDAAAADNFDFILFCFDVSKSFAKGMAFEEFSALICTVLREVQFDVSKIDLECFRQIKGFDGFDLVAETSAMLIFVYGLEDVSGAWRVDVWQTVAFRTGFVLLTSG